MFKRGIKREICAKYRDKYGMEMPILTLAKIMYNENSGIFTNIDNARVSLSRLEGKMLNNIKSIEKTKKTKYYMQEERTKTPHLLPEPDSDDIKPFILPTAFNNFIFASDFHVPNHRKEPIEAMMKYAKENNITKMILGGDLLDNTPFTRWLSEPVNPHDVPRWFDMAKEILRYFKTQFDEIYFLEGNHDFWYKRYLMQKAELLFHDPYFQLEERLSLNEIGVKFVDQKYLVKAGKLNIHHGHLTFRGGGSYANAARMLYQKSKSNMLCGHVHVQTEHTEPDVDDKICTTFTVGCMCTLRPEYQPFGGKACHGFAHITVGKNGTFKVKNYRIYRGEVL